jgi:methylenetetrahydrofolate dehydrogenase (NADP+)/methenyltetrahydrofolate cyclohydrolase
MPGAIIDGNAVAARLRAQLRTELDDFSSRHGFRPGIATLRVGNDFGAGVYRAAVEKLCSQLGLAYRDESLPDNAGGRQIVEAIQGLNEDSNVSGILPLRPFSDPESDSTVIDSIRADKDIDCFHPFNMGRLALGVPVLPPATAAACVELLESYLTEQGKDVADALSGAEVCVVGHSNIVGKPLALLLLNRNATMTVTHVFTFERGNLAKHTAQADYLIVAAGVPHLLGPSHVKDGAVVLDVGINRMVVCCGCSSLQSGSARVCPLCGGVLAHAETKIVGDVDFEAVIDKVEAITPVPGGVGAVTNLMLARNALRAAQMQIGRR